MPLQMAAEETTEASIATAPRAATDNVDHVPEIVVLRQRNMERNARMMEELDLLRRPAVLGAVAATKRRRAERIRARPETGSELVDGEGGGNRQPRRCSRRLRKAVEEQQDEEGGRPRREEQEEMFVSLPMYTTSTVTTVNADGSTAVAPRVTSSSSSSSSSKTATVEHTVMRVRSMTTKALANRIKAIERAHGAHAVLKMDLFARVLHAEGHQDLADLAGQALQRLQGGTGLQGGERLVSGRGGEAAMT